VNRLKDGVEGVSLNTSYCVTVVYMSTLAHSFDESESIFVY